MKKLLMLLPLFIFAGCFQLPQIIQKTPEHQTTVALTIGQVKTVTPGDMMVSKEDLFFFNGLQLKESLPKPYPLPTVKGMKFLPFAKSKTGETFYIEEPPRMHMATMMTAPVVYYPCIVLNQANELVGHADCGKDIIYAWPNAPKDILEPFRIIEKGSFKQELIYNGKSKDMIKITYREFNDNLARAGFTQDLVYDLSESKEISFKGMIIEVLEATNNVIKFVVKTDWK